MIDNIYEGDETFTMSLNVPSTPGRAIVAGSDRATGIIIDSTGNYIRDLA